MERNTVPMLPQDAGYYASSWRSPAGTHSNVPQSPQPPLRAAAAAAAATGGKNASTEATSGERGVDEVDAEKSVEHETVTGAVTIGEYEARAEDGNQDLPTETGAKDVRRQQGLWDEMYSKLLEFHNQHSHCRVTAAYDKQLHYWIKEQRRLHKQGELNKNREEKLSEIDFEWQIISREQAWSKMYARLKEFYRSQGRFHCRVPADEDKQLAQWVIIQRVQHEKGKLTQQRKVLLDELGFEYTVRENKDKRGPDKGKATPRQEELWNEMFAKLRAFQRRFEHCKVPDKWKDDPKLSRWVNLQRYQYRNGKMMLHRQAKLNAIGFTWRLRGLDKREEQSLAAPQQDIENLVARLPAQQSGAQSLLAARDNHGNLLQQNDDSDNEELIIWPPESDQEDEQEGGDSSPSKPRASLLRDQLPGNDSDKAEATQALYQLYTCPTSQKKRVANTVRTAGDKTVAEMSSLRTVNNQRCHDGENEFGRVVEKQHANRNRRRPQLHRIDPAKKPAKGRSWNESFERLLEFQRRHGHVRVPRRYDQDKALGRWVIHQRAEEKKGNLPEVLRSRLDDIGFAWSKRPPPVPTATGAGTPRQHKRRSWDESFELLKNYYHENGNADVPRGYQEDPRLANWVRNQRNQRESLSVEQQSKLDEIGFTWMRVSSDYEAVWEGNFEQLRQFQLSHGHCNPRESDEEYKGLSRWVQNQRRETANISDEQRSMLDSIGFAWVSRPHADLDKPKLDKQWLMNFDKLCEFQRIYKHTVVPDNYLRSPKLSNWVATQRKNFRRNHLREDRKNMLESIGFDFEVQTQWWLD